MADPAPPALDYSKRDPVKQDWLARVSPLRIILICLALLGAMPWLSSYFMNQKYSQVDRIKCQSNLRHIAQGIALYCKDKGTYPASLADLLTDLDASTFWCYTDPAGTAPGPSTRQIDIQIRSGQYSSYLYLGQNMTPATPANAIIAYEKPGSHDDDGMNVLYVNGTVAWLDRREAKWVRSELAAGINPPRLRP